MKIRRVLININSKNISKSRDFYTKLFDFKVGFESDWFIHLISEEKGLELGIILNTHDATPVNENDSPSGFFVTFVVDDVEEVLKVVKEEKIEIISEPEQTFYGQQRLLIKDPDGTIVDVSSPNE